MYATDGRSTGRPEPARNARSQASRNSTAGRTNRPLPPRSTEQTPAGSPLAWGAVPASAAPRTQTSRSSGPSNPKPAERIANRAQPAAVSRRPTVTAPQTSAPTRRRFGRVDPFCWFAVSALVVLACAFAFYGDSLRAALAVVVFTIALIVFDKWVNRPSNTDSFS